MCHNASGVCHDASGVYLTVFLPEPVADTHPAKHGDAYVIPFSPHTGSHSLLEHKQPELQSEKSDGS